MKSIADQLPPESARQLHPNRRKNEADYWAVREQFLDQYRGQWIDFADGMVIASGSSPVTVFQAAGRHPFFICIGKGRRTVSHPSGDAGFSEFGVLPRGRRS